MPLTLTGSLRGAAASTDTPSSHCSDVLPLMPLSSVPGSLSSAPSSSESGSPTSPGPLPSSISRVLSPAASSEPPPSSTASPITVPAIVSFCSLTHPLHRKHIIIAAAKASHTYLLPLFIKIPHSCSNTPVLSDSKTHPYAPGISAFHIPTDGTGPVHPAGVSLQYPYIS